MEYRRWYRFHIKRRMKGTTPICTGSLASPQYQERREKSRSEAAKAAGNAYRSSVLFRVG
jgi:hypothetical protein